MEETKNTTQIIEEAKNTTQSEENKTVEQENDILQQENKLFTQEEVNDIIRKRLNRTKQINKTSEELEAIRTELTQKENKLKCKEFLIDEGLSREYMDILDTSNADEFIKKVKTLVKINPNKKIAPMASEPRIGEHSKNPFTDKTLSKHKPSNKF